MATWTLCAGIVIFAAALGLGLFQTQRESYSLPLGNLLRPDHFSLADMPSLVGKRAVVTGANSGVGFVTARELARRGCRVVLACRSPERAREAMSRMVADGINGALLEVGALDLASLASVRAFAAQGAGRQQPLHILVLNAGLNAAVFETTEDGIELSFQANHLSHFLLARLLLPSLRAAALDDEGFGARLVVLSSDSHFDTYEPEGVLLPPAAEGAAETELLATGINNASRFHGLRAYGQAKLCNVLFAAELSRRLEDEQWEGGGAGGARVRVNAAHPGLTHSAFYAQIAARLDARGSGVAAAAVRVFDRYVAPLVAYSPERAALTPLYLAASPHARFGGRYFVPVATELPASAHARDAKLQARLWEVSEQLVELAA